MSGVIKQSKISEQREIHDLDLREGGFSEGGCHSARDEVHAKDDNPCAGQSFNDSRCLLSKMPVEDIEGMFWTLRKRVHDLFVWNEYPLGQQLIDERADSLTVRH